MACVAALVTTQTGSGQLCSAELGNRLNLFSPEGFFSGLCWGNVTQGGESFVRQEQTLCLGRACRPSVLGGRGQGSGHTVHFTQNRLGKGTEIACANMSQHAPASQKAPSSREQRLAEEDSPIRLVPAVALVTKQMNGSPHPEELTDMWFSFL